MDRGRAHHPLTMVSRGRRLPRSFFARDVLGVAPDLLGCTLSHAGVTVRITETEAYAGEHGDPGSHAFRGPTPRTSEPRTRSTSCGVRDSSVMPCGTRFEVVDSVVICCARPPAAAPPSSRAPISSAREVFMDRDARFGMIRAEGRVV